MPELPEVETVRSGLAKHIEGQVIQQVILRRANLRYPFDPNLSAIVEGQRLRHLKRRAKYLLFEFERGVLLVHLGMTGVLKMVEATEPVQKHDHVDLVFEQQILRFNDVRRFGAVLWIDDPDTHPLLLHLAPEPLSDEFDGSYLFKIFKKTSRPVKLALMDQALVVGVGNIYANEALFAVGVHPEYPANTLSQELCDRLVAAVKLILEQAIVQGGTSLKDFLNAEGKPGYFRQELKVYGRKGEPCVVCKTQICKMVLGQRATYFCPQCQK